MAPATRLAVRSPCLRKLAVSESWPDQVGNRGEQSFIARGMARKKGCSDRPNGLRPTRMSFRKKRRSTLIQTATDAVFSEWADHTPLKNSLMKSLERFPIRRQK